MTASSAELVDLPTIDSGTEGAIGVITIVERGATCPFDVKRLYWIHGAGKDEVRGNHAHRTLSQLIVAVAGKFEIITEHAEGERRFVLDTPRRGLLIRPGVWRTIHVRSDGAVLLVAASAEYDEADYIRDYDEFLRFKNEPDTRLR
jgi:dTDP-4-dehydrorhamnose 3,5-epimerase-like enzyme